MSLPSPMRQPRRKRRLQAGGANHERVGGAGGRRDRCAGVKNEHEQQYTYPAARSDLAARLGRFDRSEMSTSMHIVDRPMTRRPLKYTTRQGSAILPFDARRDRD